MKKRSITVRYNEEGIPYITPKSGCYLSFQISPIGDEIEILGNEIGLQLLARSILGIAKMEEVDMTYHIHLDELYSLNKEGKSFIIRKIENDDLKWRSMGSSMFCIYSSNEYDLRLFAQSFKEACADPLCLEEMLRGFGEYLD